jgi:hypothetical protein
VISRAPFSSTRIGVVVGAAVAIADAVTEGVGSGCGGGGVVSVGASCEHARRATPTANASLVIRTNVARSFRELRLSARRL